MFFRFIYENKGEERGAKGNKVSKYKNYLLEIKKDEK